MYKKSHKMGNKNSHDILKSNYYYCGFNCLDNYFKACINNSNLKKLHYMHFNNNYNNIASACLRLGRLSLKYLSKYESNKKFAPTECRYLNGFICQLTTNFALFLDEIGRIIRSLELYRRLLIRCPNFAMAQGNYGIDLYNYSKLTGDINNHQYLLGKSAYHFNKSLTDDLRTSRIDAFNLFNEFYLEVKRLNNRETLTFNNINKSKCSSIELNYRKWAYRHCLFLNVFNDANYTFNSAYDSLILPPIISRKNVDKPPFIFDLFNNIKQKYVSARYQFYDGMSHIKSHHFSDYGVKITRTGKGYIYGYYIEQMEESFKSFYSIFDQIASILVSFLHLNKSELAGSNKNKSIPFDVLFQDTNSKMLFKKYKNDYALKGLYWIDKDICSTKIGLDYNMFIARQIRNKLEHSSLYLTLDNLGKNHFAKSDDGYSYIINIDYFKKISIDLIKTCREAIILLTIVIRIEEYNKNKSLCRNHKNSRVWY